MVMSWLDKPYTHDVNETVHLNIYWDDYGRYTAQFTSSAPSALLDSVKRIKSLRVAHYNNRLFIAPMAGEGTHQIMDTHKIPKKYPIIHSKELCEKIIETILGQPPSASKITYRFRIVKENFFPANIWELKFQRIDK